VISIEYYGGTINTDCKGTLEVGRDSSVDIGARYWLDGPGIETKWGLDLPQPSRPALGPTQPPIQYNGYLAFPGGKAAWAW
jgi:hypothetical protein